MHWQSTNGRRHLNPLLDGKRAKIVLRALFALATFLFMSLAAGAGAAEIKVAAASDLTFAFKDVAARFQKETGNSIKLTYGSSGNFFAQIQVARRSICSFPPTLAIRKSLRPRVWLNPAPFTNMRAEKS